MPTFKKKKKKEREREKDDLYYLHARSEHFRVGQVLQTLDFNCLQQYCRGNEEGKNCLTLAFRSVIDFMFLKK